MHKFRRIFRKGVVTRIILLSIVPFLRAEYVKEESQQNLKCTPSDPRKVYPFCMMYNGTLWCDQSTYKEMPSVDEINAHLYGDDCRNAKLLYVNDSCLTDIKESDLREFDQVTIISLSSNQITRLNSFTFAGNKLLESLDVRGNKIGIVERKAFEGLHKLLDLNLAHNDIEELEVGTFDHTENLKSLNLNGNLISLIEQRLLRRLGNLKILEMRGNRISEIRDHAFYRMSNLTHLHLDGNKLLSLTRNTFRHLENLEVLTISHNQLQEWPAVYGVSNYAFSDKREIFLTKRNNTADDKILQVQVKNNQLKMNASSVSMAT